MSTLSAASSGSSERTPLSVQSKSGGYASGSAHLEAPDDSARVEAALAELRAHFNTGATKPLEARLSALRALRRFLVSSESSINAALQADLRKCAFESWLAEYQFVLNEIDECLVRLKDWTKPEEVNTNLLNMPATSQLRREPLGVVLVIAPWNYPFQLLMAPLVGALAAGNCVVLKPSELAPHLSAWAARMGEAMSAAGVRVIQGGVAPTTRLLQQRWELIFYTGGPTVARIVARAAAEHLTPTVLELGGKSPAMVLRDARIDMTAKRIVWGKLMNCGQTCIAPDYVLVDEAVHDQFCAALRREVELMYPGELKNNPDYGRIINESHAKRLAALVQPLEDGLALVVGDVSQIDTAERFVPPLFLRGATRQHRVMKDEIFGPILPIVRVSGGSADEVLHSMVSQVNAEEKPLALYVFTDSKARAERVLRDTSSGGAVVNDVLIHITNPELPFGGVGGSGMGSYHGRKSFEVFSHTKSVMLRSSLPLLDAPQRYPPFTPSKQRFLQIMMRLQGLGLYKGRIYALSGVVVAGIVALFVTKFRFKLW